MYRNYLFLWFFGILACLPAGSVAREAIVGGTLANNIHLFPYQVLIVDPKQKFYCGGGIIKDLYILTAAHCVIARNNEVRKPITVHVGTIDLDESGEVFEVEKFYVPNEFQPKVIASVGDIAVLKLKKPWELKTDVSRLHLPKNETRIYDHETVRIAGIGWDNVFISRITLGLNSRRRLRFAEAEVRNQSECRDDHQSHRKIVDDKHLCARIKQLQPAAHRGVCTGDDGSPLVLHEEIVIGILSASSDGCREVDSSGIYINVAHYRSFILHAMNNDVTKNLRVINV